MIYKCMSAVYKQIDFSDILWWSFRNHTMPVTIFQIFNKSDSMIFWQFSTKIIQAAWVLPLKQNENKPKSQNQCCMDSILSQ